MPDVTMGDTHRKRQKRRPCYHKGKDLSDGTTSQGMPTDTRSGKRQRNLFEVNLLLT